MPEAKVNKTYSCPSCDCICVNKCMLFRHIGQKHRHQNGSGDNIFEGAWTNADGSVNETLRTLYHRVYYLIILVKFILISIFHYPMVR